MKLYQGDPDEHRSLKRRRFNRPSMVTQSVVRHNPKQEDACQFP
jgi:hypothetical protein